MPEQTGKPADGRSEITENSALPPDALPSPGRERTRGPEWWAIPNFSYLLVWWLVVIGYYVVFSSISAREHKGLIDLEILSGGWYAVLTSGLIGAFYAKRFRLVWFLLSIVLAMLILLLMLLGLGALKNLMSP